MGYNENRRRDIVRLPGHRAAINRVRVRYQIWMARREALLRRLLQARLRRAFRRWRSYAPTRRSVAPPLYGRRGRIHRATYRR